MKRLKRQFVALLLTSCRAVRFLSKILPSHFVLRCGSTLGRIVGHFCSRDEELSILHLGYIFPRGIPNIRGSDPSLQNLEELELTKQHRAVARGCFRHMGESVAELLLWDRLLGERIRSDGTDVIDELLKSKRGALGLSGHFGSFELLAAYLARRGLKCSVIGRAPNYPELEKALRNFRSDYGVSVIWSDTAEGPRQIVQALKDCQVLCALIDQDTKWKSQFSPFFGLDAASPIGPIQLAIRYEIPIFSSFIRRTASMCHTVNTELISYSAADHRAPQGVLDTFNQRLEAMIRLDPSQYLWWHRRWRRRPGKDYQQHPELLPSTRQYMTWLRKVTRERNGDRTQAEWC